MGLRAVVLGVFPIPVPTDNSATGRFIRYKLVYRL